MKTFNRNPANIDTDGIKNYSKYFNQMNFKGIHEDDNIYAIDQESFRDANNVYVNSDNKLVSRPTLQKDNIPSEIDVYQYDLIDVKYIGQNTIYINKSKIDEKSYLILLIDRDGKKHILQNNVNYTFNLKLGTQCELELTYKQASSNMTVNKSINCHASLSGFTKQDLAIYSDVSNEEWLIWYDYNTKGELIIEIYEGISFNNQISRQIINLLLTDYHISTIEHYIICWNNQGAKVFDTNNNELGWQEFNDFVEVPTTKIISGSTETIFDKNEFTKQYKEQYTYSNQSFPLLPSGTPEVEVFTGNTETIKYNIEYANEYTDYKVFKTLKAPSDTGYNSVSSYNSIANQYILAIPDGSSVYLSFNGGVSYSNILYPEYNGAFIDGGLTKDGLYYYFIAEDGVHFLNLETFVWNKDDLEFNVKRHITSCFNTREIYSFLVQLDELDSFNTDIIRLYFKGPSLYSGVDKTEDNILTYLDWVYVSDDAANSRNFNELIDLSIPIVKNNMLNMFLTKNNIDEDIVIIGLATSKTLTESYITYIFGGTNMKNEALSEPTVVAEMYKIALKCDGYNSISIESGKKVAPYGDDYVYEYTFNILADDGTSQIRSWKKIEFNCKLYTVYMSVTNRTFCYVKSFIPSIRSLPIIPNDNRRSRYFTSPLKLGQGYIYQSADNNIWLLPNKEDEWLQFPILGNILGQGLQFTVNHDKYFIRAFDERTTAAEYDTVLISNLFSDSDLATITYTYGVKSPYTKVPRVSYSDTEVYLAFGDLLQITRNTRAKDDVTKINFNLPTLNNQSFIDDITAMVNISTTEVALFFLNKIIICSKVQDTNLAQGFRYDYYNTKFSLGVRLGDTVMNTLEGQYTIFPTKRGLAVMNYQAFMATTDQVIQYITDNVRELWNKFYESNNLIKIIQWNNKLIFTNNTNIILLYDLDRTAWWKWEVPIIINSAVTDQIDLRVIDTNLNKFKDAAQYYDFSEVGQFKTITWFIMSQPLHMSAPNYYKNMKQLVFQFAEGDDNIVTKTMNAQIKLYRKRLSVKEPETIKFQIENLRTFVKRFNYWKINEIQWALGNDTDTSVPKQFKLNAITIKYEIGDEVR